MNRRKLNISSWYSLGLAVVLMVTCLLLSAGATFARYRSEVGKSIIFKVRQPVTVCLGSVEYGEGHPEEGRFIRTDEGNWTQDDNDNLHLKFAIANGETELSFEQLDQEVGVRLIGTLGIQSEADDISVMLTFPKADEPEEFETVEAKVVRIAAGSAMHATFGDGWVFCFTDKKGEELTWTLEGGKLSWTEMELIMEGATPIDTSFLQLQITGNYIQE